MAANLLTIGTDFSQSADFTVTAGTPLTIGMKWTTVPSSSAAPAAVTILLKTDAATYMPVDRLTFPDRVGVVLYGPGVYRVVRETGASIGVFSA